MPNTRAHQEGRGRQPQSKTLPLSITRSLEEALSSPRNLQETLNFILDTALQLLKAEYGSLRWVNHRTQKLERKAIRLRSELLLPTEEYDITEEDMDLSGASVNAEVVRTKAAVLIPDLSHQQWSHIYRPLSTHLSATMHSELAVPLFSNDGKVVIGVLNVESPEKNAFSHKERDQLIALAEQTQEAIQKAQLLNAIWSIGQQVTKLDQNELLTCTVEILADLMYVPVCSIWLLDETSGDLVLKKAIGRPQPTPQTPDNRLPIDSFIGQVIKTRRPISSPNVQLEPNYVHLKLAIQQGWVSALSVPILAPNLAIDDLQDDKESVLGVISVYSVDEERAFTVYDCNVATYFSNQIAVALQQAHHLQYQQASLIMTQSVQVVNDALVNATNLPDLLNVIVNEAMKLLNGSGGILYLVNEALDPEKQVVAACALGIAAPIHKQHTSIKHSLSGWVANHKEPVYCEKDDPRLDNQIAERIGLYNVTAAPLPHADDQMAKGTLVVLNKIGGTDPFTPADLKLLTMMATQATLAINKMQLYEQTHRRSESLRAINELLSKSLATTEMDTRLQEAAFQIRHIFGCSVAISLIGQDKSQASLIPKVYVPANVTDHNLSLVSAAIAAIVADKAIGRAIPDMSKSSTDATSTPSAQSGLAVPLVVGEGNCIGVLSVESQELGYFSENDLPMFQTIAAGITIAIENARRLQELEILHKISVAATHAKDLNESLDSIVKIVAEMFDIDASAVYLAEPDGQRLNLVWHTMLPPTVVERVRRLSLGRSIAGKVLKSGTAIFVADMTTDPRADGTITKADGLRSLIDIPIRSPERILGVMALLTKDMRQFTPHDLSILETIGNNMGAIVEKAQLHEIVATAEEKYRDLFESAREPILIMDLERKVVGANREARHLSGYSLKELLNKDVTELIADQTTRANAQERLAKLAAGEEVPIMEVEMRHKQGHLIPIESKPTAVRDKLNNVTHIQSIWRDIRPQKAFLTVGRQAILSTDKDTLLTGIATQTMERLESDGCYVHLCQEGSDLLQPFAAPNSLFADRALSYPLRLEEAISTKRDQPLCLNQSAKGSPPRGRYLPFAPQHIPINLLAVALKSRDKVIGVLSVIRMVKETTAPYRADDALYLASIANILTLALENFRLAELHSKQQAAQKVLEQMGFVSTVLGHKLGGTLGGIGMITSQLRQELTTLDPTGEHLIGLLETYSRRAIKVMDHLGKLGKPLNQEKQALELKHWVKLALTQCTPPKTINVTIEEFIVPPVIANGQLLTEIFEGVIHNAIDAMPKGGSLVISGNTSSDGTEAILHFSDTGHGMAQKILSQLFTPFYTTKRHGGIGIGLWLSRLYLQTLGGDIQVNSEIDRGSTITIRLPSQQQATLPPASDDEEESPEIVGWSEVDEATHTQDILVVEDDPDWQATLFTILSRRGLNVHQAESYDRAIHTLNKKNFDAYIVDVRLEEIDNDNYAGLDFVSKVLARQASARLLVLSSYDEPLERARARFGDRQNVVILKKTATKAIETIIESFSRRRKSAVDITYMET